MKSIIYLLSLIFTITLQANEILISKTIQDTNVLNKTQVFIDEDSKKDFEYIKSNPKIFNSYDKNFITEGYSLNTIWLKFSIKNDTKKSISKFLELDNTMLDEIVLYTKLSDNKYKKEINGVLFRKEFNSFMRYKFEINLEPKEEKEYYLKVKSESSGLYFHLNLLEKSDYYTKDIQYQHILILFFAAITALALYNFFIFLFTKDLAHLYYSIYIISTIVTHVSFTSMNLHILPVEFEALDAYLAIFYTIITTVFMLLFSREFLETKKFPKINFGINIFLFLFFLSFVVSILSSYYPLEEVTYILLFGLLYTLFASFYIIKKEGTSNAKYFAIAWGIAIFAYVMLAFKQDGVWSLIDYFPYFYEFSILTEAILFSFALAAKISKTKELEQSVNRNKALTKELHHRVKNNMQFIISMYRLKLMNITDEKVDLKLKETEGSIQAMSKIYEILHDEDKVQTIDTKVYFETLIEEFKRSFRTKDIKISLKSNTTLKNTQQAIYCGIILNELITNSFKYAFRDNSGEIKITLSNEDESYKLIVEDNGVGFDYESKKKNSFGLTFVKDIVKYELAGNIEFDTSNHTKVTITF